MAVIFRDASREDVPALVAMLTDDPLGQGREGSDLAPYLAAYDEIAANPMHQLIVGVLQGRIVATCQLTILSVRRPPRIARSRSPSEARRRSKSISGKHAMDR